MDDFELICFLAIEKSKLLDMLGITGKERSRFVSQVHSVTMVAAISPETVNLRRGERVGSISVFEIQLNVQEPDRIIFDILGKIGQRSVFLVRYGSRCRLVAIEKEPFSTEWVLEESLKLSLDGLDLDDAWKGIVRPIAGIPDSGCFD
ncbi:MAG: DUF4391 domain-containing protein [Candidatus Methanomethylophilaceae archaeon]|nr:DUF4391 domain-containing protein [Candidatus Methanomethylophilaceae archaeon]